MKHIQPPPLPLHNEFWPLGMCLCWVSVTHMMPSARFFLSPGQPEAVNKSDNPTLIFLYLSLKASFHPCCSGKFPPVLVGLMFTPQVLQTLTVTSGEDRVSSRHGMMIPGEMSAAQKVLEPCGFDVAFGIFPTLAQGDPKLEVLSEGWARCPSCCPIHGAFPVLPLGGCLARQGLTQLGSDPLPCQVCFQQAREGTILPILLGSVYSSSLCGARHCCWTLPGPQRKQDAQTWDMGLVSLQPVYCVS